MSDPPPTIFSLLSIIFLNTLVGYKNGFVTGYIVAYGEKFFPDYWFAIFVLKVNLLWTVQINLTYFARKKLPDIVF